MRNLYLLCFLIVAALLSSCKGGGQGELVGVYNKKFRNNRIPLGMVYIPPGRTLIGISDEDITSTQTAPSAMTSFSAFFMDQTEISNAEYRQFVNWVRDSIAVTTLGPTTAPNFFIQPRGGNANARQREPPEILTGGRLVMEVCYGVTKTTVSGLSLLICIIQVQMLFLEGMKLTLED